MTLSLENVYRRDIMLVEKYTTQIKLWFSRITYGFIPM